MAVVEKEHAAAFYISAEYNVCSYGIVTSYYFL